MTGGGCEPRPRWKGLTMSTEPLVTTRPAAVDGSERGLMLAVLLMVVFGTAAMFLVS
jgi:hypothetical protein